jgi:hypothetical protein
MDNDVTLTKDSNISCPDYCYLVQFLTLNQMNSSFQRVAECSWSFHLSGNWKSLLGFNSIKSNNHQEHQLPTVHEISSLLVNPVCRQSYWRFERQFLCNRVLIIHSAFIRYWREYISHFIDFMKASSESGERNWTAFSLNSAYCWNQLSYWNCNFYFSLPNS